MRVTIIEQAPLRLITSKSDAFPDGNAAAMSAIEAPLGSLRGRKFYGLAYGEEGGMAYYAGLVPAGQAEEERFAALGFGLREIPGGPCARVKLRDWQDKLGDIGRIFTELSVEYGYDRSRPQLEFYRSQTELHLMLPLPRGEG